MSHSEGRITKPVSLSDIAAVLGVSTDMARSMNINPYSRYKPMRSSSIVELTDADKKALNWGYFMPQEMDTVELFKRTLGFSQWTPPPETPYQSIQQGWYYLMPRLSDKCRVLDFNGYDHNADRTIINLAKNSGDYFYIQDSSQQFICSLYGGVIDIQDYAWYTDNPFFGIAMIPKTINGSPITANDLNNRNVALYAQRVGTGSIGGQSCPGIAMISIEDHATAVKLFKKGQGDYWFIPFMCDGGATAGVNVVHNLDDTTSSILSGVGRCMPLPCANENFHADNSSPQPPAADVVSIVADSFRITTGARMTFSFSVHLQNHSGRTVTYTLTSSSGTSYPSTTVNLTGATTAVSVQKNRQAVLGETWTLTVVGPFNAASAEVTIS